MPSNYLTQMSGIINKDHDIIVALDNAYIMNLYTPELEIQRGKYAFNLMPTEIITREFSGESSLPNLMLDIFMYYPMESDDGYTESWTAFFVKANAVLQVLYDKQNLLVGVSTVKIDLTFDNNILEQKRMISLTFKCEYKIFATR